MEPDPERLLYAQMLLGEAERSFYLQQLPKPVRFLFRRPGRFTDRLLRISAILLDQSLKASADLRAFQRAHQGEIASLRAECTSLRNLAAESSERVAKLEERMQAILHELWHLQARAYPLHPRIFFIHGLKTGGTSVRLFFEQLFRPEEILADEEVRKLFREKRPEPGPLREILRSRMVIHCHAFNVKDAIQADPSALLMTFWREPVQQMISLFDYYRSLKPDFVRTMREESQPAVWIAHSGDFGRFLRDSPRLRNLQCGTIFGERLAGDLPGQIEECEEWLRRFHCVGITEQYSRSMRLLACVLRRPWRDSFECEANVTTRNWEEFPDCFQPVERTPISDFHRAVVHEVSPLDCAMYSLAKRIFQEQCARWGL